MPNWRYGAVMPTSPSDPISALSHVPPKSEPSGARTFASNNGYDASAACAGSTCGPYRSHDAFPTAAAAHPAAESNRCMAAPFVTLLIQVVVSSTSPAST